MITENQVDGTGGATCFAQQITGRLDMHTLLKHSASSQFALLAASRANEPSHELVELRGGVYTSGVLRALAGAGDADRDGMVSLSEVHRFAAEFVERYGSDQAPQFVSPSELQGTVLSRP